jgi:hypothetical protein
LAVFQHIDTGSINPTWDDPAQDQTAVLKILAPESQRGKQMFLPVAKLDEYPVVKRRKKQKPASPSVPNFRYSCPTCGTPAPHYQSGVPCPGCGELGESFKEWLMFKEMAAAPLSQPTPTEDGIIDSIDLRFEDYPKGTEEERNKLRRLMTGMSFYGRFPGGEKYLVFDNQTSRYEIDVEPPKDPNFIKLPEDWWEIAAGYLGNELVKKPRKLRIYD